MDLDPDVAIDITVDMTIDMTMDMDIDLNLSLDVAIDMTMDMAMTMDVNLNLDMAMAMAMAMASDIGIATTVTHLSTRCCSVDAQLRSPCSIIIFNELLGLSWFDVFIISYFLCTFLFISNKVLLRR